MLKFSATSGDKYFFSVNYSHPRVLVIFQIIPVPMQNNKLRSPFLVFLIDNKSCIFQM